MSQPYPLVFYFETEEAGDLFLMSAMRMYLNEILILLERVIVDKWQWVGHRYFEFMVAYFHSSALNFSVSCSEWTDR